MKVDEIAPGGLSPNLAFVESRILWLGGAKLKGPLASVPLVINRKAAVLGVSVSTDGKDVNIPVADPGYLHRPLCNLN